MKIYEVYSGENLKIAEKIQQRRYQILVHSYIYYQKDMNLVTDFKFDKWEHELVELQSKYPEIAETVVYADSFRGWDGSSGYNLPYMNEEIQNIAERLVRNKKNHEKK